MTFEDVKKLWDEFSDVPVDSDDRIERPFLHFEAGTDRFDMWIWFDERCPHGMAMDLLRMK